MKASKCNLSHIISKGSYQLKLSHKLPILKFLEQTTPKNTGEIQRLLGFVRYIRRHIKNFSAV